MDTPILNFLRDYRQAGMARLHMPGHKGRGILGCEAVDLTEIQGADSLYEASGIIARSEENAAALFGARRTFFSTEGSSQCVKAMLFLAVTCRPAGTAPVVLAARNVHKSFVHAAALVGFDVAWLWPEGDCGALCACPVTPEGLERALSALETPPCAVYITSPDYLGNRQDLRALADVTHRHGTLMLVDNAHGAYLRFLEKPAHPMDLGADLCCDSAHKTLPALTGGAYLHISPAAPTGIEERAREALALFGSTSPSYLTLASLDGCNAWLAGEGLAGNGPAQICAAAWALDGLKGRLAARNWHLVGDEPLKLTLGAAARGWTGPELADCLRAGGVEIEYADPDYVVLMASGHTTAQDLAAVEAALNTAEQRQALTRPRPRLTPPRRELSIREAMFAPSEIVPVDTAQGRICAAPTVACPPAVPIVVSGERIGQDAAHVFAHYGIEAVCVVR